MNQYRLLVASGLLLLSCHVFYVLPNLDLQIAHLFFRPRTGFIGKGPVGDTIRNIFFVIPLVVAAGAILLSSGMLFGKPRSPISNGRALAFLILSFALGPGLLVNGLLKEVSHRPRPVHLREFGGDKDFRPFYRFDGSCKNNCSFVSGETSSAFWTLAPALLAPPPFQLPAILSAIVLGVLTSLMRLAAGGHFLSDVVFSALMTWTVVCLTEKLAFMKSSCVDQRHPAQPHQ